MNMHHHRTSVVPDQDVASACLTGTRDLEIPGPGAVAHMSLHHKTTMSKSRPTFVWRTALVPRFTPGDRLSVYVGDRWSEAAEPSAPRR